MGVPDGSRALSEHGQASSGGRGSSLACLLEHATYFNKLAQGPNSSFLDARSCSALVHQIVLQKLWHASRNLRQSSVSLCKTVSLSLSCSASDSFLSWHTCQQKLVPQSTFWSVLQVVQDRQVKPQLGLRHVRHRVCVHYYGPSWRSLIDCAGHFTRRSQDSSPRTRTLSRIHSGSEYLSWIESQVMNWCRQTAYGQNAAK
jgi:hypothetical protein